LQDVNSNLLPAPSNPPQQTTNQKLQKMFLNHICGTSPTNNVLQSAVDGTVQGGLTGVLEGAFGGSFFDGVGAVPGAVLGGFVGGGLRRNKRNYHRSRDGGDLLRIPCLLIK
jgi:uncharacterized protein YcfJ